MEEKDYKFNTERIPRPPIAELPESKQISELVDQLVDLRSKVNQYLDTIGKLGDRFNEGEAVAAEIRKWQADTKALISKIYK